MATDTPKASPKLRACKMPFDKDFIKKEEYRSMKCCKDSSLDDAFRAHFKAQKEPFTNPEFLMSQVAITPRALLHRKARWSTKRNTFVMIDKLHPAFDFPGEHHMLNRKKWSITSTTSTLSVHG